MTETLTMIGVGLAIWWSAMTLLCLRDYFAKKEESKKKGPLTEQERAEMEKLRAELFATKACGPPPAPFLATAWPSPSLASLDLPVRVARHLDIEFQMRSLKKELNHFPLPALSASD